MKRKNKLVLSRAFSLVFMLMFIASLFTSLNAFGETLPFNISDATISDKSDDATGTITSFSDDEVINNITFHKLNGFVTYKLEIKSNLSNEVTILSITDDNKNPYLVYEYDKHENEKLNPKDSFELLVKAIYKNELTDVTKRAQTNNVKLTIRYSDNSVEKEGSIVISPKTGDNIDKSFVLLVISGVGLVTSIALGKKTKNKKISKVSAFIIMGLLLLSPATVNAATYAFNITLKTNVGLYDKLIVTYVANGSENTLISPYGEAVTGLPTPTHQGTTFTGWSSEDGTPFDLDTVITDDIKLMANWDNPRSIDISVSYENEWKPSKTVSIAYSVSNNDQEVINQYSLDGGTTWNEYTGEITINENNTNVEARTIIENTGEVLATSEKTVIKIDPVVPTVSITLGDRYYSGQELDLSTVTTATAGESGYTLKWYIDDLEISNLSETNKIDKFESEYEVRVRAVAVSGAGLEGEAYSGTIIVQYVLWDDFVVAPLTRDNIQNLKFGSWAERPENPTGVNDISYDDHDTVYEYYTLDPETGLYDVYITSPYGYTRYYDTDMTDLFAYMHKNKSIDLEYLDMFNITNMSRMFKLSHEDENNIFVQDENELTELKWGEKFNTKNVTDMHQAFSGLNHITSLDLSSFDMSNVTNIANMFHGCASLEEIDVSTWDTSKVTNMYSTFGRCTSLKTLDVSHWDTSNVTTMIETFWGCSSLEEIDVSGWDTSKVTSMHGMFSGDSVLNGLDVSRWDTSNVTDMYQMFLRNYALTEIDVSNWDTSKVTNMNGMFYQNTSLKKIDLSSFDTSNVTSTLQMFSGCSNLEKIDFKNLDLSSATTTKNMFRNNPKLKNVYVKARPTVKAGADQSYMWYASAINNYTIWDYETNGSPLQ